MSEKLKLDGLELEFDPEELSTHGHMQLQNILFVTDQMKNLTNQTALLFRAKNGYVQDLKQEILAKKAGIHTEDN